MVYEYRSILSFVQRIYLQALYSRDQDETIPYTTSSDTTRTPPPQLLIPLSQLIEWESMNTDVAIAGYGDAYSESGNEKSPIELSVESTRSALQDADLSSEDIDGVLTPRAPVADRRSQWNNIFADYLNIRPSYNTQVTSHGASIAGMLKHAAAAINGDFAETILCVAGDSPEFVDMAEEWRKLDSSPEFETPYGHFIPAMYAFSARRYLDEFDVSREDMARVAVENRKWGTEHPKAEMTGKGRITLDDVLKSPDITSPLNLLDCAMWRKHGNGGAFIVTAADRAEKHQDTPIYIRGAGEYDTHENLTGLLEYQGRAEADLTTLGTAEAARQAYEQSEMSPEDIDTLQVHTNFTHMGLIQLEDLGFCEKGAGGEFVRNGGIDFEDGIPMNTNGGPLSFGQSSISPESIIEAVRQLRGEALGLQVDDPESALVHIIGGVMACHTVTILSTRRD